MKKYYLFFALAMLFVGAIPASSQVSNDNEDGVNKVEQSYAKSFVPGQVLVKMKDGSPASVRCNARGKFQSAGINNLDKVLQEFGVEEMEQLLPNEKPGRNMRKARAYNGDIIQERDLSQLYLVTLPEQKQFQTMELVDKLTGLGDVEYAEPNYKVYITDANIADSYDSNPLVTQQWYLEAYGVTQLWNKPIINPTRPIIAIIDTGVDMTHPDLSPNLWTNTAEAEGEEGYDNDNNGFAGDVHGWDFVNNTPNVRDNNMHGTHVAGIAAAANNGVGIVGANPQALIMPVSVMQSDGSGDVATIIRGIDYAVSNGANVLNMSLGTYVNSHALRQALENAYQSAVIVAAAGNDHFAISLNCGQAKPSFPAAYSFVLGVMAMTQDGYLAPFTNYDCDGPNYSFVSSVNDPDGFNYEMQAPGVNMLSTIPGGKYKALNGTSMAAPLVAGAISALKMVKQYDTQEMLWGDLTHSSNIIEAYNLTAHPADLELVKIQLRERKEMADETEDDYCGDGEIDAGETVDIFPVLRTTWGAANNIKMHLEVGEYEDPNVVQIVSAIVDFGANLSSYGKGVSLNPLQIQVPNGIADGRHIRLKLVAICDDTEDVFEKEFVLIVNNMVKISGILTEDRTLTADHVYYVNGNLAIPEGVTLTIEPGTRLEFAEGMGLSSSGKLVAHGTPEKRITFTGHNDAMWQGIRSHWPTGERRYGGDRLYTNADSTLFTLLPTEQTPNKMEGFWTKSIYGTTPNPRYFYLSDYVNVDLSTDDALTDPSVLTSSVLQFLAEVENYLDQHSTPTEDAYEYTNAYVFLEIPWYRYDNPRDTISYCSVIGFNPYDEEPLGPIMVDCVFSSPFTTYGCQQFRNINSIRTTISDFNFCSFAYLDGIPGLRYCNFVNNIFGYAIINYSLLNNINFLNNSTEDGKYCSLGIASNVPAIDRADHPSYLGTSREEVIRPYIYEINNAPTYGLIDLSNMPTRPFAEAHGIVWKVVVNGKDAQDEFEDLAPLGVGRHKFEVYFNRSMNKAVAPKISFGVRDPYTQNTVDEDGSWNDEGTIYTAYKTITGKTKSDGTNRIYVQGAEDNEYFEIPYEKTRFNVIISAAGSMATGFAAEPKMGRVNLTWDNSNNDFDDAMGFNVYRYGEPHEKIIPAHYDEYWNWIEETTIMVVDTIRVNPEIINIETTEYIDYDVTPGETYYYYYKVLSTDLQEYDVSNVVAATPLTSELGDANGSGDVDVADVITTVNYAAGQQPKPFIFEAADMNADLSIDILDVIGIIKKILNPNANVNAMTEAEATYTIEDGTLYVESPVALAGVQVQLALNEELRMKSEEFTFQEDLKGFEHTSAWLSDNDYMFLAYNMNGKTLTLGKHALLHIGDAMIAQIRLSDVNGHNILVNGDDATKVNRMASDVMTVPGIYDMQGRKLSGDCEQQNRLPKGVYIINGQKVVK